MEFDKKKPLRVFTAFSGYDSQCLALERLKREIPGFDYELVGWSEIDKYAIQAHDALFPDASDRNFGDISEIDWGGQVPDFDMFTYSFPCFVKDTLVTTDRGLVPIQDVKVGEEVVTHTGEKHLVVKTMHRHYKGDLYKIDTMCSETIECTDEHPFYVRRRRRVGHGRERVFDAPEWVKAKDLTRSHFVGCPVEDELFSRIPDWNGVLKTRWRKRENKISSLLCKDAFWYLMGRYVGDGWLRKCVFSKGVVICCGGRYEDALTEAIRDCGFHYNMVEERTCHKYHIVSKELHEFVKRFGEYAHGKKIDEETLRLPGIILKTFLNGIFDSDGYRKDEKYIKVTTVSRELAYGMSLAIMKAYHRPVSLYKTKCNPTHVIEGRVCNQRDTYTVMFKTCNDVQDKAFYEDGYVWYPINRIEVEKREEEVYNLEVDTDNSYTANGVIVHNCQDISNAGRQKGFSEGADTRSSLLWECRRAIEAKRPRFLLMENVKALVQKKFLPEFGKWMMWLEEQGYTNFWKVMNAKDFGVPQNRERVFMISILNPDMPYSFPKPFPLERRLKDVLEEKVDESYYLKQEQVDRIIEHCDRKVAEGCGFKTNFRTEDETSGAIKTREGQREYDTYLKESDPVSEGGERDIQGDL